MADAVLSVVTAFGPIASAREAVERAVSPARGTMCVFTGAPCAG